MYFLARPRLSCMKGIIGFMNSSFASTSGVRLPMFCNTWREWVGATMKGDEESRGESKGEWRRGEESGGE